MQPGRDSKPNVDGADYSELAVVDHAHYVITREIARGGMGRILTARDRRLGREVAIKEVLANTGHLARRFEREARITAGLQHPSIVSVHEAGRWPSGEPFYAMPLVSGRSLDEAIAAAKSFDERLALVPNVLAIADAMAYAHGHNVIHRDLKPRNVVVGEFGETIVLDWGVAKQLGERDAPARVAAMGSEPPTRISDSGDNETSAGDLLGTPAYMPPEQAAGPAVDERADVYAIGAILYHVLAGRPPYVAETVGDLLAALATRPPPAIAELVPEAPTELVAIVEHAMRRDPAARYPTARELAEDLRRFQTGQLVGAHRYSLRQLLLRWVRRHITAIAAIAAAVVVGVGVGVVALTKVVDAEGEAQDQRARAVASRKDAEDLLEFLLGDLRSRLNKVGRLDLMETVARKAAAYYDAHGAATDDDQLLAATARIAIGSVLENRGDLPAARAEYDKARAALDVLAMKRPDVVKYRERAVRTRYPLGDIAAAQGDLTAALAAYRDGLARAEQLRATTPDDPAVLHDVSGGHARIAHVLEQRGDLAGALAEERVNLAALATRSFDDPIVAKDALNAHAILGRLLYKVNDDVAGALVEVRLALAIGEREAAKDPKNVKWLADLAVSHREVADYLMEQHDTTGAIAEYRASLPIAERLVQLDPANADWRSGLANAHEKLGIVLFERKQIAEALAEYQASAAMWDELAAGDPSNTDWQRGRSVMLNKLGDVRLEAGDPGGAAAPYRAALAIREKLVAKDPTNLRWRRDLFFSHTKLAMVYTKQGDHAHALGERRTALAMADEIAAANPANEGSQHDVAVTHEAIGDALAALHDAASARVEWEAARALAKRYENRDPAWREIVDHVTQKLGHLRAAR